MELNDKIEICLLMLMAGFLIIIGPFYFKVGVFGTFGTFTVLISYWLWRFNKVMNQVPEAFK